VPSLREVERSTLDDAHLREPLASRARHVVTENERVRIVHRALVDADVVAVAECIRASHRSLRDDFEVSTHELDAVADAAERGGALGARMMGGGFGGSVLALVPNGRTADVRAEVARGAAEGGLGPPTFYAAEPSPGASPVREERA
jgi:galactokinase